ncbi:MAG: choice-of-anchor J domain-containing protein [Muribaculaceae bacterium]|nr:choice-of-anchor J domain-containing protein [Muribaculaceae bacterium]
MKRINFYLSILLLSVFAISCNDEFDMPPLVVPQPEHTPNMTIKEFKEKYWQDVVNYIDTVKEDIIIGGRIVSSDESGNIYKSLYIQDETGALKLSINQSNIYTTYRIGQEIVIPLKYVEKSKDENGNSIGDPNNIYVGKYNGQQQLGFPAWYAQGKVWEATFMPYEAFQSRVEPSGLPDMAGVTAASIKISDLTHTPEVLREYQGRLVKIDDVKFADADGTATFATYQSTTNRNLQDADGNTLVVRNSGYASFYGEILPMGEGTVYGVLDYYNTRNGQDGTWQLYLRSSEDCIGFITDTKGLLKDPYTVQEAIDVQNQGKNGWTMGYIVGAVAPEVTTISGSSDIEFKSPTTLDNTLVIADSKDETDINKCLVIALPDGSPLRTQANQRDNAKAYGTMIYLKGELASFMGANGIVGNSGSDDEFKMTVVTGGVTTLNEGFESADKKIPDTWKQVQVSGDKAWYITSFDNNQYAAMTGYKGTKPPFDQWLITPALDIAGAADKTFNFRTQVAGYGSTTTVFEVYILNSNDPTTASVKEKLNPKLAVPSTTATYSDWVNSGDIDLSKYEGTYFIGFRFYATQDANYATWCLDDVKFNAGGGEVDPPQPQNDNRADLETLNGGEAKGTYGNYTTTKGWTAENCNVLIGGEADSNPVFQFIGFMTGSTSTYAMAACLNGKNTTVGVLTSPRLTGSPKKLKFNYGMPYGNDKIKVLIEVFDAADFSAQQLNPNPLWSDILSPENAAQKVLYSYEKDIVGVATNTFIIRITNQCPQGSSSNKDRVAIWNLEWELN